MSRALQQDVEVSIENVGGIEAANVTFPPGVTVLAGRNATNRTSFLQAMMAVLGSSNASLKGDADEGRVEMTIGDERYRRTLSRENGKVSFGGEPYLDDPEFADLFAFLLETNPARQAVARDEDLRDLMMRPIDTDSIQREIERLATERDELDAELDELDELERRLGDLRERRDDLEAKHTRREAALQEKEAELEEAEADIDDQRELKAELEAALDELSDARSKLEETRDDIDLEQDSIEALEAEIAEYEDELEGLSPASADEQRRLEAEIDRLRDQLSTLGSEISELQSVIQFNRDALDEDAGEIFESLGDEGDDDNVTAELVDDDAVTCWTCGSEVEREQIERTVDALQELNESKYRERTDLREQIDELESERKQLERTRDTKADLEAKIENARAEIDRREETLEDLRETRADLADQIESLEEDVESHEQEDYGEVLDIHKEANQIEFELERIDADLTETEANIEAAESRLDNREDLAARRTAIEEEIEGLRTRVERIEAEAVDKFNDHMETLLDVLEYENLERIWIERKEEEVRQGRRKVQERTYDLHVVRNAAASGTVYEDTVDHLSESEREVTGLVFALAGFLVHDVHESVPFVLLDSMEALDRERIASLIEYFDEFVPYLIVALLPEDASSLDESYERISSI